MNLRLTPTIAFNLVDARVRADGVRIYIGGESGSGKTCAAALIAEQVVEQGGQVVVLDAHGEYGVLAALAPRDVALVGYAAAVSAPLVADRVASYLGEVKAGRSLLVNLKAWTDIEPGLLDPFVFELVRKLYEHKKEHPERPLFVLVEEGHNFAPAQGHRGESDKVRIFVGAFTGGRKFNLHAVICTQAQAMIHPRVRSACNVRLFMRTSEFLDYDAIRKNLQEGVVTFDQMKKFESGEAIVVSRWLEQEQRVRLSLPAVAPSTGKLPLYLLS